MKKFFIFILCLVFIENVISQESLRSCFLNPQSLENIDKVLKSVDSQQEQSSISKAYQAGLTMLKARYVNSPFKKMKYFKRGKKELKAIIDKNPNAIDPHYIRLLIQLNTPKFLGYNRDIEVDFNFIIQNLKKSTQIRQEDKKKMLAALKDSRNVTKEQILILDNLKEL